MKTQQGNLSTYFSLVTFDFQSVTRGLQQRSTAFLPVLPRKISTLTMCDQHDDNDENDEDDDDGVSSFSPGSPLQEKVHIITLYDHIIKC